MGYTATLTNTGQVAYTGITVATDPTLCSNATPNGDQTATSGTLTHPPGRRGPGTSRSAVRSRSPAPESRRDSVTVNDPDTGDPILALVLVSTAAGSNCPAGGTDPRCSPVVSVLIPGLSITQVPNITGAVPGQVIGYTLTITNTGTAPYTGAVVTESFAAMFDDAAYGGNAGHRHRTAASYTSPVLTWTGNLAPGDAAVVTFTVTVTTLIPVTSRSSPPPPPPRPGPAARPAPPPAAASWWSGC